jgi:hypothetical protein
VSRIEIESKEVQTIFVTFGAGRTGWKRAAKRLGREAIKTKLFKSVYIFDDRWLSTNDPEIYRLVQKHRSEGKFRGFGFWLWKASILRWAETNHPHDQILYIDGGHHISSRIRDQKLIKELLNFSINEHGLAWKLHLEKEIEWCKKEVLEKLDREEKYFEDNQIQSSFICMPPSQLRNKFVQEFYTLATEDEGFNFSDEIRSEQFGRFKEHRHDQSPFSLLWKNYKFGYKFDETYPGTGKLFPIQATRNNTGINSNAPEILINIEKNINLVIDKVLKRR